MEKWYEIDECAHLIRLLREAGVTDEHLLEHVDKILLSGLAYRRTKNYKHQLDVFRPLDRIQVRDGKECRWDGKRWCDIGTI